MAAPGKMKQIAARSSEPIDETILQLLNEHKSLPEVAKLLDMSVVNLFKFTQKHNICKEVRWVKGTRN